MIMGQSLYQIFAKSFVMVILLLCSIAALALIIERFWYFTRNRFSAHKDLSELRRVLTTGGYGQALEWSRTKKNPLGRMFTVALDNISLSSEELADLTYSLVLEERIRYERLLGGLGTLANAATLLGLLGTVTGLIGAFSNIAATGSGGPAVVSKGIAEALLTTAFGLLIGIPVLFFYNYFAKKASDLAMALESTSDRLIVMLQRFKAQGGEFPSSPQAALRPSPEPRTTPAEDTAWKF
uniref:MotA/TolQ/ExbB proton channel family protein n=1 Tax=candidate division WOR-3 bacterium TaxID=2052148 RepID=A0A7C4GEA6_UNCW3